MIRREAFRLGLTIEEQNYLFDSMFRISGEIGGITKMQCFVEILVERVEAMECEDAARKALLKAGKRWWKPSTWFN